MLEEKSSAGAFAAAGLGGNVRALLFLLALAFIAGTGCARPLQINGDQTSAPALKKAGNLDTPIQCVEEMLGNFLSVGMSAEEFVRKWQGAGGFRLQQNARDYANVNPCPNFFANVLLFVPYRTHDCGSLEFQILPNANVSLELLVAKYGDYSQEGKAPTLNTRYFYVSRPEHDYDAVIIADFEGGELRRSDRPYKLTIQKEER